MPSRCLPMSMNLLKNFLSPGGAWLYPSRLERRRKFTSTARRALLSQLIKFFPQQTHILRAPKYQTLNGIFIFIITQIVITIKYRRPELNFPTSELFVFLFLFAFFSYKSICWAGIYEKLCQNLLPLKAFRKLNLIGLKVHDENQRLYNVAMIMVISSCLKAFSLISLFSKLLHSSTLISTSLWSKGRKLYLLKKASRRASSQDKSELPIPAIITLIEKLFVFVMKSDVNGKTNSRGSLWWNLFKQ